VTGLEHSGRGRGVDLEAGGILRMPSGNRLILPLKVWRNRARGDSEPLVPDVPLQVDMHDDAAVRAATLAALARPAVAANGGAQR
jgi:hypothetical protein